MVNVIIFLTHVIYHVVTRPCQRYLPTHTAHTTVVYQPEVFVPLQYLYLHFLGLDWDEPELTDEGRGMNNWVKIS